MGDGNLQLENRLRRVRSSSITQRNKDSIIRFHNDCIARSVGINRILKYLMYLPKMALILGKDFEEADKEDIKRVIVSIEMEPSYAAWTKYDFKTMIKKFYKWLEGEDEVYPKKVRWIQPSLSLKKARGTLPDELLTTEDIKRMIDACCSVRDKAIISVLYESGFRIGEFMGMRIKHVDFTGDLVHATFEVEGAKTGMRKIPLVNSIPYLATWIDNHPRRDDPQSYLWVCIGNRNYSQLMSHQDLRVVIERIAKRAGVKKKINPHNFRHSRATELSKSLTEYQLCQYFGWRKTQTATVYVHLGGRDLDKAIREMIGMANPEPEKNHLERVWCPRCGQANQTTARICYRCGVPLNTRHLPQQGIHGRMSAQEWPSNGTLEKLIEEKIGKIIQKFGEKPKALQEG